jgi:hypothetical protein
MEIIALSGYARSGKDEAARALVEEEGFVQVAFADKLREMIYAINPYVIGLEPTKIGPFDMQSYSHGPVLLQEVIDNYGWDGYKESVFSGEIRRLLQRLGTEGGRQTLWDTIWIDAALTGLDENAKVVVSDARFFNEFDAVRDRGGYVWRIERPGVGPVSDHPSETEAPNYTHFALELNNDGTLQDWRDNVLGAYRSGVYK